MKYTAFMLMLTCAHVKSRYLRQISRKSNLSETHSINILLFHLWNVLLVHVHRCIVTAAEKTNRQHHRCYRPEWFCSTQILHINKGVFELKSFSILEIALWRCLITARPAVGQSKKKKKLWHAQASLHAPKPFVRGPSMMRVGRGRMGASDEVLVSCSVMSSPPAFGVTHNLKPL